jgi:two-component system chemotaxis sensor kinase CheA
MNDRDDSMDEVVQEFLVESAENLDQLDRDLVNLEKDPTSRELLGSVFRAVHTIKGTTGFLGFGRLEQVAHKAENLLSKLRDGALQLDTERTTVLLDVVDVIRGLLARIEATGNDEDGRDMTALLERLSVLQTPGPVAPAQAPETTGASGKPGKLASRNKAQAPPAPAAAPAEAVAFEVVPAVVEVAPAPAARAPEAAEASPPASEPQASGVPAPVAVAEPSAKAFAPVDAEPAPSHNQARTDEGAAPAPATEPPVPATEPPVPATEPLAKRHAELSASPEPVPAEEAPHAPSASERTVRVDVELLETLMRQVGELVLARNQLISHAGELADGGRTLQRLSLIVSELQEDVMKTRMQPVEQLWAKLPRVVRDLATQFGKEVTLSLDGGETELDRSVLEAVKDPLTHLVRNAVDHGIESPTVREAAGKPRQGTLTLGASHQGGLVILEMTDDGAGIDPRRIAAKALQSGLISEAKLASMSTREVIDLVFQPGFSTAEVVTNVSGRGVGMDVVRTNIEKIGGTVDLTSTPGAGTTVRIKIPLTLAIIPALLVASRGARYAVPQAAVQELVRLEDEALHSQIEAVDGALIYRLRGRLLPLLQLDHILGFDSVPITERTALDVVVVQAEGEPFGLAVDAIEGTQEIVVKPLARHLKNLSAYSGATILGDGGVALILDVTGLAEMGDVAEAGIGAAAEDGNLAAGDNAHPLLLLRIGDDRRVAVPLDQVARLEELDAKEVEHAGSREAIQYRGDLLPLVWLTEVLGLPSGGDGTGRLPVVVCSDGQRSVGLVVEQIIDVVTEVVTLSEVGAAPGVLGTAVLQGRATDLLDLPVAARYAGVPFARTVDLSLMASEEVDSHATV